MRGKHKWLKKKLIITNGFTVAWNCSTYCTHKQDGGTLFSEHAHVCGVMCELTGGHVQSCNRRRKVKREPRTPWLWLLLLSVSVCVNTTALLNLWPHRHTHIHISHFISKFTSVHSMKADVKVYKTVKSDRKNVRANGQPGGNDSLAFSSTGKMAFRWGAKNS